MLWVVGTGRCGTMSAAADYGGVHEPEPWIDNPALEWRMIVDRGDKPGDGWLRGVLEDRRDMDVGCVSDLNHSFVIPLIREVDPEAGFLWLVRHPITFIRSVLSDPGQGAPEKRGLPSGWPNGSSPVVLAAHYWKSINEMIRRDLPADSRVTLMTDLKAHLNRRKSESPALTPESLQQALDITTSLWVDLLRRV